MEHYRPLRRSRLSKLAVILGECGALWGEREPVVSCVYRQHGSYVYTACYMHNAKQDVYTHLCIGSPGRASSPISAASLFLSCLCSAVSFFYFFYFYFFMETNLCRALVLQESSRE